MRLEEALKAVTIISDYSDEDNLENYLRSTSFISNLSRFHIALSEIIPIEEVTYLPSFKDCIVSERLGLSTITEENELRLIKIQSSLFRVEGTVKRITKNFKESCSIIEHEPNSEFITFYLK